MNPPPRSGILERVKKLVHLADLHLGLCPVSGKRLFISINTDELYTGNIFIYHSIYSIITCSANPNDDYFAGIFCFIRLNLQQNNSSFIYLIDS